MDFTSIQLSTTTRDRLKKHKMVKKESYDELVNRLLDILEKPEIPEVKYTKAEEKNIELEDDIASKIHERTYKKE